MAAGSVSNPPDLAKPGSGLPWWELVAARYVLFPLACRRLNWQSAARLYADEGAAILRRWDSLPAVRLGERVLIHRISGIEDSSRYWSVAMTVEHLNIVGSGIRALIDGLRRGDSNLPVARIEDVKPRGDTPPAEVRYTFERLIAEVASAGTSELPMPRGTGPRAAHPWFGLLDAYQWQCLLALHQQIHRRQIEAICNTLG